MKKIALFLLLAAFTALGQTTIQVLPIGSFAFAADSYAGSDGYGFHYFIRENTLIKTDGRQSLEYRKLSLGKIARADIENPLLIVLFYENFNAAVLLDNQLNEVKQIDFSKLETPVVAHAVGMASQNRLWVYDSLTQQIGLYDYLKNKWKPITTPLKETFDKYQTGFNDFIWIDAKSQWMVSDVFGKITTMGELPHFDKIQFLPDYSSLIFSGGKIYYRDHRKSELKMVSGIDNSVKNFYCKDQILAIFTGSGITNYKIKLP